MGQKEDAGKIAFLSRYRKLEGGGGAFQKKAEKEKGVFIRGGKLQSPPRTPRLSLEKKRGGGEEKR